MVMVGTIRTDTSYGFFRTSGRRKGLPWLTRLAAETNAVGAQRVMEEVVVDGANVGKVDAARIVDMRSGADIAAEGTRERHMVVLARAVVIVVPASVQPCLRKKIELRVLSEA